MLIWLSLGFLVLVLVVGSVWVVARALGVWRDVRRLLRTVGVGLDRVADALDELDRRLARSGERRERLEPGLARLARSRAELSVLLGAAAVVRARANRWRADVPRAK